MVFEDVGCMFNYTNWTYGFAFPCQEKIHVKKDDIFFYFAYSLLTYATVTNILSASTRWKTISSLTLKSGVAGSIQTVQSWTKTIGNPYNANPEPWNDQKFISLY